MFLISGEDDSSNLLSSNYSRIPGLETNSELIVGGISSPVANPLLTATVEPTVPTVDFVSASSLDQARDVGFSKMKQILQIFAADPEFADKIEQVFGDNLDPEKLQSLKQDWLTGELIEFPENEIVSQPEIAGGNGAFDQKNAKIYFAQEFLEANTKNPDVIADVGLEEYGHFIDSLLNSSDTPGDEGEHFAAVVQGKTLTHTELAAIQAEDDTATVVIDGQTLVIEKAANTVSLTTPDANAAEVLSGQTANPGRFTVTRTGITTNALTVNYTVGGTATKGTDYSNLTGSVTIPIGATTANIPITVIDDTSIEGSETSVVTLSTSTAYDLGTAKTGTVTIADNEVAAIAAINMGVNQTLSGSLSTTDPSNPTRTGGYYKDDYRLTGVTVGQPVKVNLNSSAFDAYLQIINESTGAVVTYNDDTNGTNNSELTFTPQSGVNYLVRVTSYGSGSTGAYSLSTTSTSPTNVSITASDSSAAETISGQTANPGQFTITRTGSTSNALTVNYTVAGTATKGTDYSNLTGSLTIPAGSTTATLPVNVIDDSAVEGSETSVVSLSSSSAYTLGSTSSATVTITDNDVAPINMGVNQTVSGSLSTTDPSNSTRTGSYKDDYRLTGVTVGQPVKVNLNSSAFDAYLQIINESTGAVVTYNDDTNGTNNSELTFTPQSGVNYLVRVTSYGSGSTGAYSLSTTSTSPTNVSITASDSSAAETISGQTANPGQFTITRTGSTSNALTVNYTVAGTATKGTDYSNLTGSLTIPAGSTTATLPVNVIDDSAVEGSETSVVSLSSSSAYTLGSTSSATVTITDNDAGDWFTQNIQDPGLQSIARSRASDNVLDRNDMIAILGDAKDGSVIDANELTNLRTLVNNASRFNMPDSVRVLSNKIVNSDPANQSYQGSSLGNLFAGSSGTQMDNLINKWFLGLDHPSNPYTYQYATGSLFVNGATYQDINQGYVGDCYYLASLAATALRSPSTIQNMFIDNGDNTYTVRFYNSGVTDYVTVDRYLPTSSGTPIYAKTPNGELWVALAEKAYAQVNQSGWIGQSNTNSYSGIEGGLGYDAIPHVTGRPTSYVYDPSGIVNTNAIINAFNAGSLITIGSKPSGVASNVAPGHEYTLVGYNSSTQQFTLYNPWGMNGGYAELGGTFKPGQLQLTASQLSQSFDYWAYTTNNGLPQYGSSTTLPPERSGQKI